MRRTRSVRPSVERLESIVSLDGSGLPDVFPDPLFPAPDFGPPTPPITPPGYVDLGGVLLRPGYDGASGAGALFKWAIVGIITDIASGNLPGDGPTGPPPSR